MSEKKGPFDAAINYLTVMADRDFANGAPHRGSCRAAIRVLEAAGKVDKKISLEVHNRKPSVTTTKEQYTNACRQIRALLASLPERGKEKK